jgi:hypothetical protein
LPGDRQQTRAKSTAALWMRIGANPRVCEKEKGHPGEGRRGRRRPMDISKSMPKH